MQCFKQILNSRTLEHPPNATGTFKIRIFFFSNLLFMKRSYRISKYRVDNLKAMQLHKYSSMQAQRHQLWTGTRNSIVDIFRVLDRWQMIDFPTSKINQ